MDFEIAFSRLKADLGYEQPTPLQADLMKRKLAAAKNELADKGIPVGCGHAENDDLWISYAAALYRNRDGSRSIPELVKYQIRNKQAARTRG